MTEQKENTIDKVDLAFVVPKRYLNKEQFAFLQNIIAKYKK